MRRVISVATLCGCAVIGLVAADVWETKPFTQWTDKDVQAVLTDSPWAGKGSLTHARAGGNVVPVPDWKVIVTWRTGLPIRQALIRREIGPGGMVTVEQQAILDAIESHYIIAVDGLPGMFAGTIQSIGMQTALLRDGFASDGTTATLIFGFPKTDPITLADKDVEFSTTIGAYHVKRKFRMKDMVLQGEPAL